MNLSGKFVIDAANILEKTYTMVSIFLGSKEIFRLTSEEQREPVAILQEQFFEQKMSSLLIEIATSLRILDDQFKAMDKNDPYYITYAKAMQQANMDRIALFNDGDLHLRSIYNKIIHSDYFGFDKMGGIEAHETDYGFKFGVIQEREVTWHHFRPHVRLAGKNPGQKGDKWSVLLSIVEFANAVYTVSNAIINMKR